MANTDIKNLTIGLCKGRHDIDGVTDFVFNTIENVHDFDAMRKRADEVVQGFDHVDLFVTDLTAAFAAVVAACLDNCVNLTAHHFDTSTGKFNAQQVISMFENCCVCGKRTVVIDCCTRCGG